jgi:hypothetical protein
MRYAAPFANPQYPVAGGWPLGREVTFEHFVGGGTGEIGRDADVGRPRLRGQVRLDSQKRLECGGVSDSPSLHTSAAMIWSPTSSSGTP